MGYGSFQMNLSSHREMWHSFLAPWREIPATELNYAQIPVTELS
jgi:hypothetical protein